MTRISPALPLRTGVSLKPMHFREVLECLPEVGFFEVHAENYMVAGGPFHHFLERIRSHYPISLHGVGLSIGSENPIDETHLDRLLGLIERSFLSLPFSLVSFVLFSCFPFFERNQFFHFSF